MASNWKSTLRKAFTRDESESSSSEENEPTNNPDEPQMTPEEREALKERMKLERKQAKEAAVERKKAETLRKKMAKQIQQQAQQPVRKNTTTAELPPMPDQNELSKMFVQMLVSIILIFVKLNRKI
jgi:hypothetical protein